MRVLKDFGFFGAFCVKPVWLLVIAAFALWFGTASPVRAEITHGQLYTFTGEAANDNFGYSVSGAGDVNNDGYADLIVGAYAKFAGGPFVGRAYVYSGQTGALLYTFTGQAAGDYFGSSVSGAGDVNKDGYADLIVGAPFNDAGGDNAGRAYVYSGQTGVLLYTFTGEAISDYFGHSVSGAGDVNKDGYADLIVGALYNDAGGSDAGRAYVYSGQNGALLCTFTGEAADDNFGYSVSGAGDVNNDGYADLIVGAPSNFLIGSYAGRAYVYSGQTGALLYTFTGAAANDYFGYSVSGAGDVNNDGYADLIVGAYQNDAGGSNAGRAYVYSGQTGTLLYTFTGAAADDNLGSSVSGAGDVNNDGYADLIVGAPFNNAGGFAAGRAYVYSGQTGTLLYTFTGAAAYDLFGISVSGAGDVNNDGYADLIVGAYLNDARGTDAGRAYVFSSQEICSYEELYAFTGAAAYDWFGRSVSGAGDVNNDGYDDLIVGAYGNDAGGTDAGRAYVYSGQTGALLYTFTGEAANDYFGRSVSGAGDVNKDGYDDLIVGAYGNDAGGTDAGR
ncbi:MAG: integrin alpha, partial [candidate division Zixibacteria bacterium]|nr:integrin alpha [candidate division Zixibacteria bacterium]